ncbi:3-ketoacyl-ACP reductase [Xinfangfangia sp. CPCC 101601]|uniref:3-ketoacyl-ACP reductase n=1 Tax=Pseudogemmobacter lacusdianii TaxID=3069608 RepID=A0ABU0VSY5_9RHOB|nr:3-ketoacyl-ACP reductase [Xinfangfangia sp. CPCC 101601]MDQ2064842.1 3-ketoacyl-ACP reductase [Xinfangfangia sp. CPCC 101601]
MDQTDRQSAGVAFVTGSSRGIGRGIALALAKRGFDVVIHGRSDRESAEATAKEAAEFGVRSHVLLGDVGDIAGHAAMVAEVEAALGPISCFVNNAGVGALRREDVLEAKEDSYDHCMLFNAKAGFFFTQAVAKRMAVQPAEGRFRSLVMISSVSAHTASINRGEYCVSKAAAGMVASVFAARMAEFGVSVYDVRPGVIETDMSRMALAAYQQRIDNEKLTLIPRIGQPEDVGRTVAALAAGDLPYATGQILNLDGGMSVQTL